MNQENNTNSAILLNRRQRRQMLRERGILRLISKLPYFGETRSNIRSQNLEEGRKMHQARLDQIEKSTTEFLEQKLERVKRTWESMGYNAEEIKMLEESWSLLVVKDKETRRSDINRARELMKEAQASRRNR